MIIAACYGQSEPEYATANCLVAAFRNLGHEVIRVGSYYHNWPGVPGADVTLEDRPFPERYTYDEIIGKTGGVDLFLQIEPHFYFFGPKPKNIKSAYYFTDPHRGGWAYYNLARGGSFDVVFCGQPAYTSLFTDIECPVFSLPPAFDSRRKLEFSNETTCDISFCGQTGLKDVIYEEEDELGRYTRLLPAWRYDGGNFEFPGPGYDYAERAAMLSLLSRNFDLRVYQGGMVGNNYMLAIQAGKIGFNRSLLGDIGIRCYEVMAAGRVLVTDEIDDIYHSFGHRRFATYRTFYKPFFENFILEYRRVAKLIEHILKGVDYLHQGQLAYEETYKRNLWEHRAEKIIKSLANS